jgi:hypothetical protein
VCVADRGPGGCGASEVDEAAREHGPAARGSCGRHAHRPSRSCDRRPGAGRRPPMPPQTGSDLAPCRRSRGHPQPSLIVERVRVDVGRSIGDLVKQFADAIGDRQLARGVPAPLVASSAESVSVYPRAAASAGACRSPPRCPERLRGRPSPCAPEGVEELAEFLDPSGDRTHAAPRTRTASPTTGARWHLASCTRTHRRRGAAAHHLVGGTRRRCRRARAAGRGARRTSSIMA